MAKVEKDSVTGMETTGHEWDGIKELDTPLPKWWLITFYACIIWAIGYWVVYPAWPTMNGYTKGVFETTNRLEFAKDLKMQQQERAAWTSKFEDKEVGEILEDNELLSYAMAGGKAVFADNCQPCHGANGSGAPNFPVLADDDWIWGGTVEDIEATVLYGIRSTHDDTRISDMPSFIEDEYFSLAEASEIADFVVSLASTPITGNGADLYEENCAACHGEEGEGQDALGAPTLSDGIWLFGEGKEAIVAQIAKPNHGVMPYWEGRLTSTEIKQVSIYVHSLGGGE